MVNVAQLVEHQIVALRVVGSIPTIHPTLPHEILRIYIIVLWVAFSEKSFYISRKLDRGMAQLVAHSLWERGVASSSLAAPTIFQIVLKILIFLPQ